MGEIMTLCLHVFQTIVLPFFWREEIYDEDFRREKMTHLFQLKICILSHSRVILREEVKIRSSNLMMIDGYASKK